MSCCKYDLVSLEELNCANMSGKLASGFVSTI